MQRDFVVIATVLWCLVANAVIVVADDGFSKAWQRHTIDDSSRGADGARLLDVNGDGQLDLVTPWEEGGEIHVCLHPGDAAVDKPWPLVVVGRVASPEDAVLVDLDGDGAVDVVSSCEGALRSMFVHWAPRAKEDYLDAAKWETVAIPVTESKQAWMYALPMQIDGRNGIDLMVASKGQQASVGWLQAPSNPRDLAAWKYHRLYDAGWVMSLIATDVNHDGKDDVLVSDRKGPNRGVLWLEHPGRKIRSAPNVWAEHRIGGNSHEVMFIDVADVNGDDREDIVVATHQAEILLFMREENSQQPIWKRDVVPAPYGLMKGKSVAVGDLDLDGLLDIVHSTEPNSGPRRPGVTWLKNLINDGAQKGLEFDVRQMSSLAGQKFDLLQIMDVDHDGDLDVITCEERDNLGLFWYENPHR